MSTTRATYVSEMSIRAAAPRRRICAVTTSIVDADGLFVGYLVAQYPIEELARFLASVRDPSPGNLWVALVGRVLDNLLANAIKHTPAGGEIAVRLDLDPERHVAILEVRDPGEGIPAHELPRLFHKYGRAASQCRGTRRDTGLGLLFSRLVAEAHGGRIHVESEVGRGSRFVVELPLLTAP